jgi:hypothetical protein
MRLGPFIRSASEIVGLLLRKRRRQKRIMRDFLQNFGISTKDFLEQQMRTLV